MENTVEINGDTYRRVEADRPTLKIVIADNRGLTFIGYCDLSGDDEFVEIFDARCIIRWGTTKHLAELVNGPTDNTVLGASEDVLVARRNIVAVYSADSKGWAKRV